jgi:hypothetical protein
VKLTVREHSGVAREAEPVTSGVPVPKGELTDIKAVRLTRNGREVPAQFRVTGLWRPGKSIRWILLDTQSSLPAKGGAEYVLEYGPGVSASAKPEKQVSVAEDGDGYTVNTGAAVFRVSKKRFTLFEEVKLADGTVLVARPAEGEKRGALISGLKATVTRAIPGEGNKGKSHLIYVKNTGKKGPEDYTLRFTAGRDFEVSGAKSGPLGKGSYRKDFAATDGSIAIPADGWLNWRYPQPGDTFTFRTVPDGAELSGEGVFGTEVLEAGPLRTVIRVQGSFGPTAAPALEYTAWYHFHAGSGRVRLAFSIENNDFGGRTSSGNARNADIGGVNCVFFDEMKLRLPMALKGAKTACLLGAADTKPIAAPPGESLEIYQDSSGGGSWDRYKKPKCHPRPSSYVTFKGYQVLTDGKKTGEGDRALGWLDLSGGPGGLTVTVREFWQNFPKALVAGADGSVEVGLFPGRYAGDFPLRSGEHKTHEVLFYFHPGGASAAGGEAAARAFSNPLRLEPASEWFAETRALGELHPYDPKNYPAYEVRNMSTIGVFPEGAKWRLSLVGQIEKYDFYGWMDYGDVPADFESGGQWGMKYDMDYKMAQQYARTLDPRWWRLFRAADRHTADIDVHHQPHYPEGHYVKGGVWAHSLHDEPGHKNPNRNYNHFTSDLSFGARGTAAMYHLTGDWKARRSCLEIAENALYMKPHKDPGEPRNLMGVRGSGCSMNRLLEGYLLTGEEKYLEHARWVIKTWAFDGKPPSHPEHKLWSSMFYMIALARYVEMFPDDAQARAVLLAHLETTLKSFGPENHLPYTTTPQPDGSVKTARSCGHYNVMGADVLSIGYRLTGEQKYLDTARKCFAYGVTRAGWQGRATYCQVHSANGAMHGNAFMVLDSEKRSK